jgi:hypothetical protein
VRQMRAKNLAEQHAREHDVVCELRLAHTLRARVNLAKGLAYNVEIFSHRLHRGFLIQSVDTLPRQFEFFTTHAGGREFHRLVDLNISGTTAQIA